jgi:predicted HTH transcriptional regulator
VILLGVSETDSGLEITGVSDAEDKRKKLWDTLHNRQKISNDVLFEKNIYIQKVDDKDVIVMQVPRADRHDKPVYINNDLFGGTFRRNHEGDYHCTPQQVKSMLRDQSDLPIDSTIIDELSWQELDTDSIRRYRNRFMNYKPSHIWNELDDIEFLKKIGAIRKTEKDVFSPTLAGLVMFGTEDVITQIFPDYFLDYREKYDENRWTDRVVSNLGEWSGNIFDFFFRIAERLTSDLKRPFAMRNAFEREDDTEFHKALREVLANALIHADYYGRRGIVIEKRRDKIVIANPGICRPDVKEVMEGNVSDPRNPILFKMFALIDIGERSGSGVYKLIKLWQKAGWELPYLETSFENERSTLTIPIIIEEEELTVEKSAENTEENENVPENVPENRLNKILNLIDNDVTISMLDMSTQLNVNHKTIKRDLQKLKSRGILERVGPDKGGYWKIIKKTES